MDARRIRPPPAVTWRGAREARDAASTQVACLRASATLRRRKVGNVQERSLRPRKRGRPRAARWRATRSRITASTPFPAPSPERRKSSYGRGLQVLGGEARVVEEGVVDHRERLGVPLAGVADVEEALEALQLVLGLDGPGPGVDQDAVVAREVADGVEGKGRGGPFAAGRWGGRGGGGVSGPCGRYPFYTERGRNVTRSSGRRRARRTPCGR